MSFFDKLGKTISDTTHSVVEKTKSSTDTIRLNGLISDEERLINAAYLNMGKKYAELHSGDAEPEFQEFLSAIAASQEKISGYREQIRKNKHLLVCQSCGAEIPECCSVPSAAQKIRWASAWRKSVLQKRRQSVRSVRQRRPPARLLHSRMHSPSIPTPSRRSPVRSAPAAANPELPVQCSAPSAAAALSPQNPQPRLPRKCLLLSPQSRK